MMQVTHMVLLGVAEAFLLLISICAFLLFYLRKLKRLVKQLQDRTGQLTQDLQVTKEQKAQLQDTLTTETTSYITLLNDQILQTRRYHQTLKPTQDIKLDLNILVPKKRQIAAFRHAILTTEKEALHAGEDGETVNWDVLENKISQIIAFYQTSGKDDSQAGDDHARATEQAEHLERLQQELDSRKKRIDNLEKFKSMFFEMEDKWHGARQQASAFHQKLFELSIPAETQPEYESLLNEYHKAYDSVGSLFNMSSDSTIDAPAAENEETVTPESAEHEQPQSGESESEQQPDKQSQHELNALRQVAQEQQNTISALRDRLNSAETQEEKENIIAELNSQLERQAKFIQESDTCIQLLEAEIDESHERINTLETELAEANEELVHIPKLKKMVQEFTRESKDMLEGLSSLEKENEQLMEQVMADSTSSPQQLQRVNSELQSLRNQYSELEERYLQLRSQK